MNQHILTPKDILVGFCLGIGDFLSAVPVFQRLGELGHKLTIVASPVNLQMVELLNIAENDESVAVDFSFGLAGGDWMLQHEAGTIPAREVPDTTVSREELISQGTRFDFVIRPRASRETKKWSG